MASGSGGTGTARCSNTGFWQHLLCATLLSHGTDASIPATGQCLPSLAWLFCSAQCHFSFSSSPSSSQALQHFSDCLSQFTAHGCCLLWPGSCDRDTGVFWWGSRTPSSPSASGQASIPAQNQRGGIIPPSKWEHRVQPCLFPTGILPATEGEFQPYIPFFIDASPSISCPPKCNLHLTPFHSSDGKAKPSAGSPGSHSQTTSSTQESIPRPTSGGCWPEPAFIPPCP